MAIPSVSSTSVKEHKSTPEDVRNWTPLQLQQAVCSLKPHFMPLFEFELKDVGGDAFLALQTADAFLSRGVDVRSRREWLAQLSKELALRQKLFDDAHQAVPLAIEKKLDDVKAAADGAHKAAEQGRVAAVKAKTAAVAASDEAREGKELGERTHAAVRALTSIDEDV